MSFVITLFFGLCLKHLIIDFFTQTQTMVEEKGFYLRWGGIEHAIEHIGGTIVSLCFIFGIFDKPFNLIYSVIFVGLFDGIIHYHIDYFKMKLGRKFGLTPNDKWFWYLLGLDQFLHYCTYIGIVIYLSY